MGRQSTARDSGSTPASCPGPAFCTSALTPVRATFPRTPLPTAIRRPSVCEVVPASALISISLVRIVHDADADVIVAEVFLDLAHDVGHHLLGVLAGNRHFRNVVEERQMAGAALLLGKQARILDRHSQLAGRGLHDFQVPRLELQFPLGAQRRHHSRRLYRQGKSARRKTTAPDAQARSRPPVSTAPVPDRISISSGSPVLRMYSVNPLPTGRERLGATMPPSISSSKRISSSS